MIITVVKPSFEIITPEHWIAQYPNIIELCGRTCYKSEDRITIDSASKFVRMLIKSGHLSVLEHASITVRVTGSRSMSHQLVRHRLNSFSQESQRYCDYNKLGLEIICPEGLDIPQGRYMEWSPFNRFSSIKTTIGMDTHPREFTFLKSIATAYQSYLSLRDQGFKPEEARSVLPNATKTELVITCNLRQWRHIFEERALNKTAQTEIRELTLGILKRFTQLLPDFFKDLIDE